MSRLSVAFEQLISPLDLRYKIGQMVTGHKNRHFLQAMIAKCWHRQEWPCLSIAGNLLERCFEQIAAAWNHGCWEKVECGSGPTLKWARMLGQEPSSGVPPESNGCWKPAGRRRREVISCSCVHVELGSELPEEG